MDYDNTNRGTLFKNDKQGNDKRPDYTGSLNVGGADFQLSAWIKSSKAGAKYMSLSIQPKRAKADDKRPERSDVDGYPKNSAPENPTYGRDTTFKGGAPVDVDDLPFN